MPIHDEIRRIAALAHIDLDDAHARRLAPQIAMILEHVAAVSRLDIDDVLPMTSPGGSVPPRDDEVVASLSPDSALAPAPESDNGHFAVPRVFRR